VIGDVMSDRHFFLIAHDCTQQWEDYVAASDRLAEAVLETQAAVRALADARDALRCAVDQKETVND
jgi:hypothetical protein